MKHTQFYKPDWLIAKEAREKKKRWKRFVHRTMLVENLELFSPCWLWHGKVDANGNPLFVHGGNEGKEEDAREFAWKEKRGGKLPKRVKKKEEYLFARCGKKLCVNPKHAACSPVDLTEIFFEKPLHKEVQLCDSKQTTLSFDSATGVREVKKKSRVSRETHVWTKRDAERVERQEREERHAEVGIMQKTVWKDGEVWDEHDRQEQNALFRSTQKAQKP